MGNFKKMALIVLLSKKTREHNGNTKAIKNFTVKLENGRSVSVFKGQDIVFDTDKFGFGTKAFEDSNDDNLFVKIIKTAANGKVSDFQYIDWEDISSIV